MIKVTFKDNGVIYTAKVLYIRKENIMYRWRSDYSDTNEWSLFEKDLIKVEKQVKDLTIEEIDKLGDTEVLESYDINGNPTNHVKVYYNADTELKLEEYIDITEIVKGDSK